MNIKGLNGNQLKLIALITMTIDHIGMCLFPQNLFLRIIGRSSMPIYAYMIAEGCRYTKNKRNYLLLTASVGLLCQIVYWVAMGSLYQCIMVTFSLSIVLIYALDHAMKRKTPGAWAVLFAVFAGICFVSICLPKLLQDTDFRISYDIYGIVLPALIFLGRTKAKKIALAALGLCMLNFASAGIQWYSLLALPLLALYDGSRGKARLKYLFYIYYPAHLAALYLIELVFFK